MHLGQNATFGVPDDPYTDSERERLKATLDSIYEDFKSLVAEGRSGGIRLPERKESSEPVRQLTATLFDLVDAMTAASRTPAIQAVMPSFWSGRGLM